MPDAEIVSSDSRPRFTPVRQQRFELLDVDLAPPPEVPLLFGASAHVLEDAPQLVVRLAWELERQERAVGERVDSSRPFACVQVREPAPGDQLASAAEVSGDLVAPPAFKAGGTGDPCPAGSIPVHLRQHRERQSSVRSMT